mgnify:CR=1 FL=1
MHKVYTVFLLLFWVTFRKMKNRSCSAAPNRCGLFVLNPILNPILNPKMLSSIDYYAFLRSNRESRKPADMA